MIAHLDYEGRSRSPINDVGANRYAEDESTEIFMAGVSEDSLDAPVYLWINPKYETADCLSDPEAIEILRAAELIYAHNAPFEKTMTDARGRLDLGIEPIPVEKWRCTAAMARKAGLPNNLEGLMNALGGTELKDKEGKALIKFFCQPTEDGTFNEPRDHPEKWWRFCQYCKQDVRAEKYAGHKLRPFELTGAALETFQFDMRMNARGVPINVPAVRNAHQIITTVEREVTAKFREITGLNPTQGKKIKALLNDRGLKLDNMQAETIEEVLKDPDLPQGPRDVLELYQKVSYAATKKIATMLDCVCRDGTVKGMFMYYGAGTGRWSAGLVQPHNFKKTPKWMRPITAEIYKLICEGVTAEKLDLVYGDPLELISGCIRNFLHLPGMEMLDGDYSAIEARIICWLAGQWDILKMWAEGKDLYKYMASLAYDKPESQVDEDDRDFGKRIELGCGFQMGPDRFMGTCEQYNVPCDAALAKKGVKVYRTTHPEVVKYWYLLDGNARLAIKNPGQTFGAFTVRKIAGIPFLLFRLRSGRSLAYPHPAIQKRAPTAEEREAMADGHIYKADRFEEISYWGEIRKGIWGRVKLYGGKLAENETQATAADFMSHGAITAEKRGMNVFMLVHDQGLALRDRQQTAQEYAAALSDLPTWAKGFPLKVEAKICPYYRK